MLRNGSQANPCRHKLHRPLLAARQHRSSFCCTNRCKSSAQSGSGKMQSLPPSIAFAMATKGPRHVVALDKGLASGILATHRAFHGNVSLSYQRRESQRDTAGTQPAASKLRDAWLSADREAPQNPSLGALCIASLSSQVSTHAGTNCCGGKSTLRHGLKTLFLVTFPTAWHKRHKVAREWASHTVANSWGASCA